MRIVCQQLAPIVGDLEGNLSRSTAAIEAAVADGADVVVLPELATSGYVFTSQDEAAQLALPARTPRFDAWTQAAGDAIVVAGFCEQGEDGHLYNSAVLLHRDRPRTVYRKVHLWDREKLVFEPGDRLPPVVTTRHGRLGLLVCYDLEFPELTRALALGGAELLVVPTNWPLVARPPDERAPEVLIAMATARINRCFVACCDRVGTERGQEWTGGTTIIDEEGWILDEVSGVGTAAAALDLSRARTKTLTPYSDVLGDRRPELYGALTRDDDA